MIMKQFCIRQVQPFSLFDWFLCVTGLPTVFVCLPSLSSCCLYSRALWRIHPWCHVSILTPRHAVVVWLHQAAWSPCSLCAVNKTYTQTYSSGTNTGQNRLKRYFVCMGPNFMHLLSKHFCIFLNLCMYD